MNHDSSFPEIWKRRTLRPGQVLRWQIGPLDLIVQRTDKEWMLTHTAQAGVEARSSVVESASMPEVADWRRWAAREMDRSLQMTPVTPDRPVIARPEDPFTILPGDDATFFISIPVWIRVSAGNGEMRMLCEVPSLTLSNTWFGTPTEGELCYGLRIHARRSVEELTERPYRAICPLHVRNPSEIPLEFLRLCLRMEHLGVYRGNRHLWTNEVRVRYRGADQRSEIEFGDGPPPYDGAGEPIGEARNPQERNLLVRTFENLRAMTGTS